MLQSPNVSVKPKPFDQRAGWIQQPTEVDLKSGVGSRRDEEVLSRGYGERR